MLDEIKTLRERYESAQDEAATLREEYHSAIRKLYMSGVSLRQIAEELGISHQRVHNIVGLEPPKRRSKRMKTIVAVLGLLATSGLFGSIGVMLGIATADYFQHPIMTFTINQDPDPEEVAALQKVLLLDSRIEGLRLLPSRPNPYSSLFSRHGVEPEPSPPLLVLDLTTPLHQKSVRETYGGHPIVQTINPPMGDDFAIQRLTTFSVLSTLISAGFLMLAVRALRGKRISPLR
jgi:hypothetical protein